MLVPLLVLGVMGCGGDFVVGTETDAFFQGSWIAIGDFTGAAANLSILPANEADEYIVAISAGMLSVRYGDLIIPFRTEFTYATDGREIDISGIETLGAADGDEAGDIVAQIDFDPLDTFADPDDDIDIEVLINQIIIADVTRAFAGYFTLFRYEDNLELATITVMAALDPNLNAAGAPDGKLAVFNVVPAEDVWYIEQYPIPKVGLYEEL